MCFSHTHFEFLLRYSKLITSMLKAKLFILFLILTTSLFAQDFFKENGALRFNMIYGYNLATNDIWKGHKSMNGPISGFEIGYSKFTSRSKHWERLYGTPRIGLSFQTILMNKPDTFGTCYSLLPNIEFRVITLPRSEVSAKIAIGGTYVTRLFDEKSNFDNRAISSHLNFGIEFSASYHHEISNRVELNIEGSFFHVSNGNFSIPNGGYNLFYGKAGINYFFDEVPYLKRRGTYLKSFKNKAYYTGYVSYAYRNQGTFAGYRQYSVLTLHQSVMKKINKISNIGVGLDAFYDPTSKLNYYMLYKEKELFVSDVKENEKYHVGIGLCYELMVGKLTIPMECYEYIYDLKYVINPTYVRFGLKYNIFKKFFVGGFVKGGFDKSMKFESAYMEFATGWSIYRNR